ncbi:MAG: hypothetical protein ACR2PR_06935 [Pseudohongiellaceae bacterium]
MTTVTKLPAGITDKARGTLVGDNGPVFDPDRVIRFDEDFLQFLAADYTITGDTGDSEVRLSTTEPNGVLEVFADSVGGSPVSAQQSSLPFSLDRDLWIETRFKVDSIAQTEVHVAISDIDASIRLRDTLGFLKETDGVLQVITDNGTTEVETPTGVSMVDDTYIRAGIHYYGGAFIDVYVDDLLVIEGLNIGVSQPGPTSNLGPSFSLIRNDASDRTLSVDYFNVYGLRAL